MLTAHLQPRYRAALFRRLDVAEADAPRLDRLFQLLGDGCRTAQRARMAGLAAQFAAGQTALLDALRGTGHFLAWELAVIRLGLDTGDARASYRYLAAHYARLAAFQRQLLQHSRLPLAALLAVGCGLPALGFAERSLTLPQSLLLAGGTAASAAAAALAGRWLLARWRRHGAGRRLAGLLYQLPGVGALLSRQQSLHYFSALERALGAGLPVAQALRLAADALPDSPRRAAFAQVQRTVAAGGRLSEALRRSGALDGVQIRALPEGAATPGVALAPQVLAESTRIAVEEGMAHCARWLPQWLLAGLALVLLANLLAMS